MQNLITPKILCDGRIEDCIENKFSITVEDDNLTIDIKNFVDKELSILSNNIKDPILDVIKYKKSKMFGTLQNNVGLPIYFNILEGKKARTYLIVCAFGEIQPTRYQIYLEGIFSFTL